MEGTSLEQGTSSKVIFIVFYIFIALIFLFNSRSQHYQRKVKPRTDDLRKLTKVYIQSAQEALKSLIAAVNNQVSSSVKTNDGPHILIYFDEAHTLASELAKVPNSETGINQKFLLDVLLWALNELRSYSLFAVFLSTQSNIDYLTPARQYARSARYREHIKNVHAPINETPFDCFGNRQIVPHRLTYENLDDVVLISLFGRPLYAIVSRN